MKRNQTTLASTVRDLGYLIKLVFKTVVVGVSYTTGATSKVADTIKEHTIAAPDGFMAEVDRKGVKRLARDYHTIGYTQLDNLVGSKDKGDVVVKRRKKEEVVEEEVIVEEEIIEEEQVATSPVLKKDN